MPRRERPLDGEETELTRFAADLRQLREKAGLPTYRELARRAHFSAASLSEAAGGQKLPSLAVTLGYVRACDGDAAEWERRWRELAAETSVPADDGDNSGPAPYAGLAAFDSSDADRFFGRERHVADLVARIRRDRLVALLGASGAGKSSLLRAGLIPKLDGPVVLFTPGTDPIEECAVHFAALTGGTVTALAAEFRADLGAARLTVRQILAAHPDTTTLTVVVDQFEETFTLSPDPARQRQFVDLLLGLRDDRCRVVLGVRADFYGRCTAYPGLLDAPMALPPMTGDELREAIVSPAKLSGCTVDAALVSRVIGDAAGEPGVLPLVSHALLETWRRRRGNALTLAAYEQAGGIEQAIGNTAEQVYTRLGPQRQALARRLLPRLVALGEGTEGTKRRVAADELDLGDPEVAAVLRELAAARLLTVDRYTVELTHEALIRRWPRLGDWLAEDREGWRVQRRLTDAVVAWEQLDRDPGGLYRGARLTSALDWAGRTGGDVLTSREREFLDASVAARDRDAARERRHTRLLRRLVAVLAVLLVATAGATAYAWKASGDATRQRNTALSAKVAGEAAAQREVDPPLAAQLSLAAYRLRPTPAARSSLLGAFTVPFTRRLTYEVNTTAFTPDVRWLYTGGDDRTIRAWHLPDGGAPALATALPGQTEDVESLRVTRGGRRLVAGGFDGTVTVFDLADPARPRPVSTFRAETAAPMLHAEPGHDGTVLATAGFGGPITLWDTTDPNRPARAATLTGHTELVEDLEFSPDGRYLASGSADGTAVLWDIEDPRHPVRVSTIAPATDMVDPKITGVAFSPDGRRLATAGFDHRIRLWSLTDPARPAQLSVLTGHVSPVQAVAFAPDGRTVAGAGWDATVRLWDVADPRAPVPGQIMTGHTNTVRSLTFAPGGHTLASTSDDHSMLLTDLPGPILSGHRAALGTAAFSPDGRLAALGSEDYTVRLWTVADPYRPRPLATLDGLGAQVKSVAFAPDGRLLAAAGIDGKVGLWDVTEPAAPHRLPFLDAGPRSARSVAFHPRRPLLLLSGDAPAVRLVDLADPRRPRTVGTLPDQDISKPSARFAPDGRSIAVTVGDRVELWDVEDPARPRHLADLEGHTDAVRAVAFSPDGRTLATAGQDRAVRLWNVTDPSRPALTATATGHTAAVWSLHFSPDSRTLASASLDRTTRLWDTRGLTMRATLTAHTDRVHDAVFRADGRLLLTVSQDRTARLWPLDENQVADRICARAGQPLTPEQWQTAFPGPTFQPPCR